MKLHSNGYTYGLINNLFSLFLFFLLIFSHFFYLPFLFSLFLPSFSVQPPLFFPHTEHMICFACHQVVVGLPPPLSIVCSQHHTLLLFRCCSLPLPPQMHQDLVILGEVLLLLPPLPPLACAQIRFCCRAGAIMGLARMHAAAFFGTFQKG